MGRISTFKQFNEEDKRRGVKLVDDLGLGVKRLPKYKQASVTLIPASFDKIHINLTYQYRYNGKEISVDFYQGEKIVGGIDQYDGFDEDCIKDSVWKHDQCISIKDFLKKAFEPAAVAAIIKADPVVTIESDYEKSQKKLSERLAADEDIEIDEGTDS